GYIVDHHNRKRITLVSQLILILCALTLTWLSVTKGPLWVIYAVLAVIGATRAFNNPAENALTPLVVPAKLYQNAVTWSTSTWQIAAIVGPSLSGFIIALTDNPATVYFTNAVSGLALVTALLMIHPRQQTFAAA